MKIRELLADPANWAKGNYARNREDRVVEIADPEAVKFCLVGAAHRCYPEYEDRRKVMHQLRSTIELLHDYGCFPEYEGGTISLTLFNDDPLRTHADLMRVLEMTNV